MAGKSHKGRSRRGAQNSTNYSEQMVPSDATTKGSLSDVKHSNAGANGLPTQSESPGTKTEAKESEAATSVDRPKQGDVIFVVIIIIIVILLLPHLTLKLVSYVLI